MGQPNGSIADYAVAFVQHPQDILDAPIQKNIFLDSARSGSDTTTLGRGSTVRLRKSQLKSGQFRVSLIVNYFL